MVINYILYVSAWSKWGAWSECSYSCGGGIRQRSRTCRGGTNCVGLRQEEEGCNTQQCGCEFR